MTGRTYWSSREGRTLLAGAIVIGSLLSATRLYPAIRTRYDLAVADAAMQANMRRHDERLLERKAEIFDLARLAAGRRDTSDRRTMPGATPMEAGAAVAVLLDGIATRTGVRISSSSVRADSTFERGLARASVRAFATADVIGLAAMLREVENSGMLLAIREFTVTQPEPAAGDLTPESLRVEMVVEALVRPGTTVREVIP